MNDGRLGKAQWGMLLTCVLAGCGGKSAPRFDRVFAFDISETNEAKIAIARDGTRFVIASPDGLLFSYGEPWATPTRKALGAELTGIGLFGDGRLFAADREHIEVWDAGLSRRDFELRIPAHVPDLARKRVALSADRRYLAVDDAVYDLQAGRWTREPIGHAHQTALGFAGDTYVVTAGFHDRAVVVRALSATTQHRWASPEPIVAAALTRNAARVIVVTREHAMSWEPTRAEPDHEVAVDDARDVQLCAGERFAAVLGVDTLYVLELPTLRQKARFALEAPGTAVACDEMLVAAGDEAGRVYAWDIARNQLVGSEQALRAPVHGLAVAASPRRILAVANNERGAHALLLHVR